MYQAKITNKKTNSSTTFHNFHSRENAVLFIQEVALTQHNCVVENFTDTWEDDTFVVVVIEQIDEHPNQ